MSRFPRFVLGGVLAATAALASTRVAQADPDDSARTCPSFVHGAKLTVSNIERGVQIKVTTPQPENVAPLRQATRKVAGLIQSHQRPSGSASTAGAGTVDDANDQAEPFPALEMHVKDIPGGTQVDVRAEAGTSVAELRQQGQALLELWQTSSCINASERV